MTGGVILTIAALLASQTLEGWSALLLVALKLYPWFRLVSISRSRFATSTSS